ncbi:hypothetical protein V6N12_027499 [Hibiscus sabdariffa]|uniref:ABC transporter domain-containing protein n=1 Tax=Hibiscus sabdariffa TaxID=183260 RepID=A0ABR2F312_9ROSI
MVKLQIYVDGIPLEELDIRWLRENIGFIGQDPDLFNMDVKSNIKYGCPRDVKEEDIEWAAKQAYVHEFISSLPHGYQTMVDNDLLSGGQKQRIAIARAILRDPAILVLDEATSALDAESEHYLKNCCNGRWLNCGDGVKTHAWEKDMLATCTAKMAGKVTVGIEDEGKLQQESWRWVCKKKERSNKKTKAAGFATASTPCRNIPMRILLKLCFIVNTNGLQILENIMKRSNFVIFLASCPE